MPFSVRCFFSEPVNLETVAQVQPSPMKHHPKVVHSDVQSLANLFASQAVNFTERKSAGRAFRQGRKAVVENFPKITPLDQFRRCRMPVTRRVAGIPMVGPLISPGKEFVMLELFALSLPNWSFAG